jgi:NAD(P)-dependent dehydrogenase (short-subunit alcohol dehydrogenase family)
VPFRFDAGCQAEFAVGVEQVDLADLFQVQPDGILRQLDRQRGIFEDLQRIFQINVFGQLELIRGLLPSMRNRGSGVIANVTSLGGTMTFPFFGAYNSTKWALEGISEGLWHELKPFGVRVKAIEPGFVETAVWHKALPSEGPEAAESDLGGSEAYRPFVREMLRFEGGITNRTTPEACAVEIARAIADESDRLRYPWRRTRDPSLARGGYSVTSS